MFDPTGRLVAVLDCSSIDPQVSDHAHALTLAATITAAREIEERLFREVFQQSWIVAAVPCDDSGSALLVAVDHDRRIVGADQHARVVLGLGDHDIARGVSLGTVFDCEVPMPRRNSVEDLAVRVTRATGTSMWQGLITAPDSSARRMGRSSWHTRPRIAMLENLPRLQPDTRSRGGLPPALTRRVREYIDSHLDENIGLDTLAATAGLSVHHFARAFRQSVGEPPHSYVLRRRIDRAQQMLKETNRPLSEIALAAGFSDHSHFARHFRRLVGMTPSAARWNER